MSIDLDWSKLDASLATKLVDALNRTISTLTRPSFIGPVAVTALDFGTVAPDIEIIDVRDIYRDFTEDDTADGAGPGPAAATRDEDDYEWVSRRVPPPSSAPYPYPPHVRHGPGPAMDFHHFFNGSPATGLTSPVTDQWRHMQYQAALTGASSSPSLSTTPQHPEPRHAGSEQPDHASETSDSVTSPQPAPQESPNLQLHLYIRHESDMRITITTSLLINYPSPMFMALPIKLSVTGLIFMGQVVVAYEGSRKRIHLCIVDELDPYGPATNYRRPGAGGLGADANDEEEEDGSRPSKPLPIGQRLLPSIFIESEIGQTDKHVLRNVTRVEKFMQEVIRKTIEDELVFPNFHTILMENPT